MDLVKNCEQNGCLLLLLLPVLCDIKLNIFSFGVMVRQNKEYNDINLGFQKSWWEFFPIFLHFIDHKTVSRLINDGNDSLGR